MLGGLIAGAGRFCRVQIAEWLFVHFKRETNQKTN